MVVLQSFVCRCSSWWGRSTALGSVLEVIMDRSALYTFLPFSTNAMSDLRHVRFPCFILYLSDKADPNFTSILIRIHGQSQTSDVSLAETRVAKSSCLGNQCNYADLGDRDWGYHEPTCRSQSGIGNREHFSRYVTPPALSRQEI